MHAGARSASPTPAAQSLHGMKSVRFARHRPQRCRFRPKFRRSRCPIEVKAGRTRASGGQSWARIGRIGVNSGSDLDDLDRQWPNKIGSTKAAHSRSKSVQNWPMPGFVGSNCHMVLWPVAGREWHNFGQRWPGFGEISVISGELRGRRFQNA